MTYGATGRRRWLPGLAAAVALLGAGEIVAAQSVALEPGGSARRLRVASAPPLELAVRSPRAVVVELPAAPLAELESIGRWNRSQSVPRRNGFVRRAAGAPLRVGLHRPWPAAGSLATRDGGTLAVTAGGDVVWGGEVYVAGAHRLRLGLGRVRLPASAQLWVWGETGEMVGPFGTELLDGEGRLWTPSVEGERLFLEVLVPGDADPVAGEYGFDLDAVLEIVPLGDSGQPLTLEERGDQSCLVDAACIDDSEFFARDSVERATARLQFVSGISSFLCTGALLADLDAASSRPLLLTANHCLSSQSAAASLEAFWDYVADSCDGSPPSLGSVPRSNGATLLATGASSDYTLLELDEVPADRAFLGWDADPRAAAEGTVLHRLSHTNGGRLRYSRSRVDNSLEICTEAPPPRFLYTADDVGGTFGGSSGSPNVTADGIVLGQLLGGCGPNPTDGCDRSNGVVDGAFAASFPALAPFLAASCSPSPTVACLLGGRFQIEVEWRDHQGREGVGRQVAGSESDTSALLYFFRSDNWEMLIKVLPGCSISNHFWVFFAATTDVEFTVTVTDTFTMDTKRYSNPLGQPADAVTDTSAFATCP